MCSPLTMVESSLEVNTYCCALGSSSSALGCWKSRSGIVEWCAVLGLYSEIQRIEIEFRKLNGHH